MRKVGLVIGSFGSRQHLSRTLLLVALCLILPLFPRGTRAQDGTSTIPKYSGAFLGVSVSEALLRVLDETQISIAFESEMVTGPLTYCKAIDLSADDLLKCILQGTGLDFIRLSSGTYVIVPASETPAQIGSLVGRVLDAETLAPLSDANVFLADDDVGASTNSDGRFALAGLTAGRHRLHITHVAYHAIHYEVTVESQRRTAVELGLIPRIVTSAPIVIEGFEHRLPMTSLGAAAPVEGSDLLAQAGTRDVLQNLGTVAGVHLGSGLSDVHVQGGDTGEQQVRLDGMPVFLPIANAGYFGPFSPDAIGQVTVRKAGFSAAHGSGLSGVVDLTHRLAPARKHTGLASVDLMSANLRLGGSFGFDRDTKATWMIGVRKSLWDVLGSARLDRLFTSWGTADEFLSAQLGVTQNGSVTPPSAPGNVELDFHSVHAAAKVQFGGFKTLSVSLFRGGNLFGLEGVTLTNADSTLTFTDSYEWLNRAGQIRYEWVATSRLLLSASAWSSKYELSRPTLSPVRESLFIEDFNEINQSGARIDWQFAAAQRHLLAGNVETSHTSSNFSFSLDPLGETVAVAADLKPAKTLVGGYLEDRVSLAGSTTLTLGSRFTYVPDQGKLLAEPRLEFRQDLRLGSGSGSARLAMGRYRQYLNSVDVTTSGIATLLPVLRYWLPIGQRQKVPQADHVAAGLLYQPDRSWELGVESFYKRQRHLLVPDYERELPGDPVLTQARGYAYGFSTTVSRDVETLQVEARYEFEVVRRRVPDRFSGEYRSAPWEAPHRITISLHVKPTRRVTAFARWQSWWQRSWAFRQSYYDYLEPEIANRLFGDVDLSKPQRHILPAFSQLDIGAGITFKAGGMDIDLRGNITNLFGRDNVRDWSLVDTGSESYMRAARLATPFLPSLSLSVGW